MYCSASVTQVSQVTLLGILRFSTGLRSAMLSWGLFRPCQNKTQRQTLSCELSPRSTARFGPAHSEKEKRQADVWERYAVLCPLVGLTLLQCKLRTSLTAQFCVWFLLLCWCGAELWQQGRRWTCPTPALHLPYTCTVCHVGWRGRGCDTVVEKQPLLGWMCPLTSQQHDELSN